jgi:hypothetical protein
VGGAILFDLPEDERRQFAGFRRKSREKLCFFGAKAIAPGREAAA